MRFRPLLTTVAVSTLITFAAAPAAGANWLGLPGLNEANGASWVREYATGTPPSTMYAATEAGGVFRSTNNGLSWSAFNNGLEGIPGAKDVRTVFTSGATVYAGTGAGLFKAAGGGGFQPVAQGPEDNPKDPKKLNKAVQAVFTGALPGSPMLAGVASGGVYRSTDGGATWKPPAPDNGMVSSETVWSLGSFKDNGAVVYAATTSGIYLSTDFGSTWTLSNDGISGVTLRAWADDKYPNIYYAGTSDGLFRSINAGITWTKILGGTTVRAITQFNGLETKRIYAATGNGVQAGQTDLHPLPGATKWRQLTLGGMNTPIVWGLTSFINTPGTLLAGTQGSGGYALVLTPALHTSPAPTLKPVTPVVGTKLELNHPGGWSGTPQIEFTYQWQDCTAACVDIENATDPSFVIPAMNRKYRLKVTGQNDFPTGGQSVAYTATTNASGANPADLPGENQTNTGTIKLIPEGQPQPGTTLQAQNWLFNPAETSRKFQWYHCENVSCTETKKIDGATGQNYVLTNADVGKSLCVAVTGTNAAGSKTLGCTGKTLEVLAPNPQQTGATTLAGTAYVGHTLVSGAGTWAFPGTRFERRWQRCNAEGESCETLPDATPAYVLKPADLGKRMRAIVTVDSNAAGKLPAPVSVPTPLSAVVTTAPVEQEPQDNGGQNNGGGGGGGQTPPPPPADKLAPSLSLKSGKATQLKLTLSEAASLSVEYQRVRAGRKAGKGCKVGGKKGKKCTAVTKVATVKTTAPAGSTTVKLPKRKLKKGNYRLVVIATDAAGNKSAAKTVTFKIK